MGKVEEPAAVLFEKSKWIWAADASKKNSHIILRRTFSFGQEKPPARAICHAACEGTYYMFVNGNAVVWNGGLKRGKHCYYDEFDIAKFLIKGDNVIVIYCQYIGEEGRDYVPAPRAGFLFECQTLDIASDKSFTVYENPAYKKPKSTNCCYAGADINYDASLEGQIQNVLDPAFNSSLFVPATEIESYPDTISGVVLSRPIPAEKFSAQPVISKTRKSTDQFDGDTYTITFPREIKVTPYMEVTANGQEKIYIYTDRSEVQGCFGDERSKYRAHTIEYTTKPTVNIFEGLLPMVGETLCFSMPRTVKVMKLGYREIGYDTAPTCSVSINDEIDGLFEKGLNTLYASMGSTIMDTPERERTMWLGDSSIAARALYLAYNDADMLVSKVIGDILEYGEDGNLFSCVPGNVPVDIPSHGLLALGEYGIFAQFKNFIGNNDLFRVEFEKLADYVMQWEMTEHGVSLRDGTRRWYDNLYNVDEPLVENAMYYSACKFLMGVGREIGNDEYDEMFQDRMDNIADYVESCWDGVGYASSEDSYDDRANAFIALAGLVPDDRKAAVSRLLSAVYNASPYLEWAVLEALCKLGRRDLAYNRFMSRYATFMHSDKSTLGEDFNGFGTHCQSYQSAVIFEIVQMFGGIDVADGANTINIRPDFTAFKDFRAKLKLATGELEVRYKYSPARIDIIIDNDTTARVTLEIDSSVMGKASESRTIALNKGKNKFTI